MAAISDTDMAAYASQRLTEVEALIASLTEEADALRKIKDGADALARLRKASPLAVATPASADQSVGDEGPRGKEAARLILKERGIPMNAAQVAKLAIDRGWIEDSARVDNAMRTNLDRAVATYDDVDKVGRGLYAYVPAPSGALDFDAKAYLDEALGVARTAEAPVAAGASA